VSWKEFAEGVFDLALGAEAPQVAAGSAADWPAPARRPVRGTLDTRKLERTFGVTLRPWREAVAEIVGELQSEQGSAA
jgi:dTDP-4-dehydrorhamnose reductase